MFMILIVIEIYSIILHCHQPHHEQQAPVQDVYRPEGQACLESCSPTGPLQSGPTTQRVFGRYFIRIPMHYAIRADIFGRGGFVTDKTGLKIFVFINAMIFASTTFVTNTPLWAKNASKI